MTRLENGKFSIALPFCKDNSLIANTYGMAYAAPLRNERQLDAPVRQAYREFMAEYLSLGHMELVPENEVQNPVTYYFPHHAILRPDSLTTELRVVFNALARNSSGLP